VPGVFVGLDVNREQPEPASQSVRSRVLGDSGSVDGSSDAPSGPATQQGRPAGARLGKGLPTYGADADVPYGLLENKT
jgi:hypothetical protein